MIKQFQFCFLKQYSFWNEFSKQDQCGRLLLLITFIFSITKFIGIRLLVLIQLRQICNIERPQYNISFILITKSMKSQFEEVDAIDFGEIKKNKAKKKAQKDKAKEQENKQVQILKRNEDRYKLLLNRIIETLTKNNPDLAENTKIMLKPPKVERMGSKKTAIINFISLCKQLDRHPEHVMNFFLEDLGGTSGAIGNSGLVIKTLLNSNNVENLFKKYISEYVQCQLCRRQNTELIKDEKMRLWNLHCNSCKSNRSVRTIKGAEKKYSDYEAEQQTLNTTSQPAATD